MKPKRLTMTIEYQSHVSPSAEHAIGEAQAVLLDARDELRPLVLRARTPADKRAATIAIARIDEAVKRLAKLTKYSR